MDTHLEKALEVPGWMNFFEMSWLAEQASKYCMIAEVGSWMGRTTMALAENTKGTVIAVDTWQGSEENQEFLKDKEPDYLYKEFRKNLAEQIKAQTVIPMRMPSLEAAVHFRISGVKFGMVFIDASHDYENVKADILAWRPLIMKDGIIILHDYDWGYPGVVHAVRELISPTPLQAGGSSLAYAFI